MEVNFLKPYGITDEAFSIPNIHLTEMYQKFGRQIKRGKVVDLPAQSITTNADSWVSALGEDYVNNNGAWVFTRQTPDGLATTIIVFNEDGSLKEASVFSPFLFKKYEPTLGTVEASRLASTLYQFTQKEPNQMTSILSGCSVDLNEGVVNNTSLLDLVIWHEHPNLPQLHKVVWSFLNLAEGEQSTALIIEVNSMPLSDNVTIIVRPQHFVSDPKPIAVMFENVSSNAMKYITIEQDETTQEAYYDQETNTVFGNPNLAKWQVYNELHPSDQTGKRENDNSPVIDLRTGDSIGNW